MSLEDDKIDDEANRFFPGGIGIGVIRSLWLGRAPRGNQVPEIHVSAENIDCQDLSPEELASERFETVN
jgi:hypothetical protein